MARPSPTPFSPRHAAPPRYRTRATRRSGQRTRAALLDAASRLFRERGLAGVTTADIAAACDAFPSQVTYYFGSKEALFVEAACHDVLRLGATIERAAATAATREEYARALVHTALSSTALPRFVEALLLASQRSELAPLVADTLDRLHTEGARAWSETCRRHGWEQRAPADAVARGFWAQLFGLCVEVAACGTRLDVASAEAAVLATLRLAEEPGDGTPPQPLPHPHRRI